MSRASLTGPIGLRREVAILVPASLLVLLALGAFTLLSYRDAVEVLVEQRRGEALRTARHGADELSAGASPAATLSALRRYSPAVVYAVLLAASDSELASSGESTPGNPLLPFIESGDVGEVGVRDPVAGAALFTRAAPGLTAGPGPQVPGRVAALLAVELDGMPHLLRVDLDANALAGRRRGLGVLSLVVLVAGLGVVLMLILFLRQLLAPYDTLLARAREVGGEAAAAEDEVALLVRTFERGIAALAAGAAASDGGEGPPPSAADAGMAALRETLAVSLESGLLLLDRRGRVIALNPVGAALLDLPVPPPEAPLGEALAPYPGLVDLLRRAVERGQPIHRHEENVPLTGGGERTLGLTVHPLRRAAGATATGAAEATADTAGPAAIRGFLVLFADLTEARRQAEEARLAENLARLGELAAGVAHELRNSLATIRGYLTLIERAPDEAGDYLGEVRREADHLQRVLEDFLSFARPGSARLEPVSLAAVAERAAGDPALDGEAVEVSSVPAPPPMLGDPQLLERAVRNLLRNAVEANREAARPGAPPSPAVRVYVGPSEGGVELTVTDHGDGVAPEVAERLYQPFATGRPGGVGLGLALAHRIVTLHGGTLRLDADEAGGTVARMWFPT